VGLLSKLGLGRRDHSLVATDTDPETPAQEAASEDVARVEQDDKYFDPDSPANEDAS
jgi:hypothetical protein